MSAMEVGPPNGRTTGPPNGRTPGQDTDDAPIAGAVPDPADHFTLVAEEVHVPERLIAAPAAGVFRSAPPEVVTAEGEIVRSGQVVGSIEVTDGEVDVTSAHTGFLMGLLALPGERVREEQPLAWVRVVA
jgi:biotin carboxyl carrier protein